MSFGKDGSQSVRLHYRFARLPVDRDLSAVGCVRKKSPHTADCRLTVSPLYRPSWITRSDGTDTTRRVNDSPSPLWSNTRNSLIRKHEPKTLKLRSVFFPKVAPEFFRCGTGIFHFPRQKQKVFAPCFQRPQAQKFWHANWSGTGYRVSDPSMRVLNQWDHRICQYQPFKHLSLLRDLSEAAIMSRYSRGLIFLRPLALKIPSSESIIHVRTVPSHK